MTLAAALLLAASCTPPSHTADEIDSSLATADAYLADGNTAEARRTADAVTAADTALMDAPQLARLALVYMQLNERTDDPAAAPQALSLYRKALRTDSAATAAYIAGLGPDMDSYALTLAEIAKHLSAPRSIPADEPPGTDSTYHTH